MVQVTWLRPASHRPETKLREVGQGGSCAGQLTVKLSHTTENRTRVVQSVTTCGMCLYNSIVLHLQQSQLHKLHNIISHPKVYNND